MLRKNLAWIIVLLTVFDAGIIGVKYNAPRPVPHYHHRIPYYDPQPIERPEQKPNITTDIPQRDMSLQEIYAQLDRWHAEAPEITEVGVVGESDRGQEIKYIRVGKKTGPKVLIMSTIHGNEHLCTMTTLGVFNRLLKSYMKDDKVTELLRTRDIYYIPVASADGFVNNSREVEGRDPNRDWNGPNLGPKESLKFIKALKAFHEEHQFKAVMSCHNFGPEYFYPWGYTSEHTDNEADFRRLLGHMAEKSGYGYKQFGHESAPPYYGYEADWFYSKGAISFVNEIGRNFEAHQAEIAAEVEKNFGAFLVFFEEAPVIRKAVAASVPDWLRESD